MKMIRLRGVLLQYFLLFGICAQWIHPLEVFSEEEGRSWPIYRGDQMLSGFTRESLPERMRLLWTFKTEDAIRSSPVIGNGMVFFGSFDGKVYSLDVESGRKLWEFNTESSVEASPILLKDTIYVGSLSGILYSLDARSGKQRWTYETRNRIAGSANWTQLKREKEYMIFVGSYDNMLHCVDSKKGKKIWTFATQHFINGSPALYGADPEALVFGGCDAQVHLVSVVDGAPLGQIDAGSYIAASVAVSGANAFCGNYTGRLISIDLSRRKIIWEYGADGYGAPFFSSPAIDDERVVIGSRDGGIHCVDRKTGEKIWIYMTGGEVDSSPVICGDRVVAGSTDGRLYIIRLDDGAELWSYEIGAGITSSPAVAGGRVIIGADDGRVYAFGG